MKRTAAALVLLAGLGSGCTTTDHKADLARTAKYADPRPTETAQAREYVGPHGEPVTARGQAPGGIVRADGRAMPKGGIVPVNGFDLTPSDVAKGGWVPSGSDGVPGFYPGRGIMPVPAMGPYGAVAAVGALPPAGLAAQINARTSIRFGDPERMRVTWYGPGGLSDTVLTTPARYNFPQGGIYRLKLSNIPGRGDVDLYPTLEVVPATAKTAAYLAHSSVPVSFTDEDFEQVLAGNFLIKVIYLPDPAFQDVAAVAGPVDVITTRLEPGVDPIAAARQRGEILAIVRIGNIDLEAPNTPGMDAPPPGGPHGPFPPGHAGMPMPPGAMGMMPPGVPPGLMPPGMMPPGMLPPGMMRPGMPPTSPASGPAPAAPVTGPAPGTPVSKSSTFPWSGR